MRKVLNFDLDTKKLKEIYPNKNYRQAYSDIRRFLIKNGFEHTQNSRYISINKMPNIEFTKIMEELSNKHDWLKDCCKTFVYHDIGERVNALELLKEE